MRKTSFPLGSYSYLWLALVAAGCSSATVATGVSPRSPSTSAPQPVAQAPLPPLTRTERALGAALKEDVSALVGLGARSSADTWNLDAATDHLASRLESYGYDVKRLGFEWQGELAQNLEVTLEGLRRGDESVVVTASFDSNAGSPGADDNASGVAGLLALARQLHGQRRARTVKLVFLSSAGPREQTGAQGARHYAQRLATEHTKVTGALELRALGHYSSELGSQRWPKGLLGAEGREAQAADFVALVSHPEHLQFASAVGETLTTHCSGRVRQWVLPRSDAFVGRSGHLEFVGAGFPALLLTDTLALRSAATNTQPDVASALDFEMMARVVAGLGDVVNVLAGPVGVPAELAPASETAPATPAVTAEPPGASE